MPGRFTSWGGSQADEPLAPGAWYMLRHAGELPPAMIPAQPVGRSGRRYEIAAAGVIMLIAASYFAYAALWSYVLQTKANASFVPVTATVVEASVRSAGSATASRGASFSPHIVYRYSIGGKDYENDRYYFTGDGWRDRPSVEAVTARFPVGSTLQIYADADNPVRAVIDRSRPRLGMLLFLLPFTVFGFGIVWYGLRR